MRPYRGKRIDGKGWIKGDLHCIRDHRFIFTSCYDLYWFGDSCEVHPDTVGQYLGKVKNGDLYEKDIVDMPYQWFESNGREREITEEGFYRGEVVLWPSCGVRIKNPVRHTDEGEEIRHKTHVGVSAYISIVRGNIHENPELLI